MGRIDDDGIDTCVHQGLHTVQGIEGDTDTCCHAQTTFLILARHRLVLGLCDILIGDQTDQTVVLIHHGEFLDFILLQDLGSSRQVCLLMGGHEMFLRHDLIDGTIQTTLEAQVTVGDDTHQMTVVVYHGDTTDMILRHDVEGLCHRCSQGDGDRIIDHTVLCTFHDGHLTGLVVNRHILVDYTDTALTRDGDGHL